MIPIRLLVCFCEVAARDPFFLVGKGDHSKFQLTELTRLKIGTVSEVATPWLCLQHDLRAQGVDPARLNRLAERTMSNNLEALRRGELDVVQVFEPYVSMALRNGGRRSSRRGQFARADGLLDVLASRDSIRRNRAAFDAMVRATRRTLSWVAEHSAEGIGGIGCAVLPDHSSRNSSKLVSALPECEAVGAYARSVATGVRAACR